MDILHPLTPLIGTIHLSIIFHWFFFSDPFSLLSFLKRFLICQILIFVLKEDARVTGDPELSARGFKIHVAFWREKNWHIVLFNQITSFSINLHTYIASITIGHAVEPSFNVGFNFYNHWKWKKLSGSFWLKSAPG